MVVVSGGGGGDLCTMNPNIPAGDEMHISRQLGAWNAGQSSGLVGAGMSSCTADLCTLPGWSLLHALGTANVDDVRDLRHWATSYLTEARTQPC